MQIMLFIIFGDKLLNKMLMGFTSSKKIIMCSSKKIIMCFNDSLNLILLGYSIATSCTDTLQVEYKHICN